MHEWAGLEEFLVADVGSFTRAARRLDTSQVSREAIRLEEKLHLRRMHRPTRQIALRRFRRQREDAAPSMPSLLSICLAGNWDCYSI